MGVGWDYVGSLVGLGWEYVGVPLGVCWEKVGMSLVGCSHRAIPAEIPQKPAITPNKSPPPSICCGPQEVCQEPDVMMFVGVS